MVSAGIRNSAKKSLGGAMTHRQSVKAARAAKRGKTTTPPSPSPVTGKGGGGKGNGYLGPPVSVGGGSPIVGGGAPPSGVKARPGAINIK